MFVVAAKEHRSALFDVHALRGLLGRVAPGGSALQGRTWDGGQGGVL
jgi:hypothetical protein